MPPTNTIIYVVVGVGILTMIAAIADWFIANPIVLVVVIAAIGGGIFLYRKAQQSKNRV